MKLRIDKARPARLVAKTPRNSKDWHAGQPGAGPVGLVRSQAPSRAARLSAGGRFLGLVAWVVLCLPPARAAEFTAQKSGGTLRLARLFDPATLDAVQVVLTEDFLLLPLLHQTLLDVRGGTNLVPGAARAWTISPDKRIYTFWLRPGVQFSS